MLYRTFIFNPILIRMASKCKGLSRVPISDIIFANNAFLDEIFKNLSFKIAMGRVSF